MARRRRSAFTLLEMILALGLSVIVLAAIGWAIQLHLKALDTRRSDVEESQLARAVLKLIADDLHSVVAYNTIDFNEAARIAALEIPGTASGDIEAGGQNFEQDPADDEDDSDRDISADLTPGAIPGLYGNQYQLQIDVSRLPRIEDFDPLLRAASGKLRDLPSDVKSVAYYLQPDVGEPVDHGQLLPADGTALSAASASPGQGWGRGLVRRALDRAATQWAFANGDTSRLNATGEVLAMEIVALEFRYFDGQQWQTQWDSEQAVGLPMAVEVAIGIAVDDGQPHADERPRTTIGSLNNAMSSPSVRIYHQVIRIPSAEPTFDAEAIATDVE